MVEVPSACPLRKKYGDTICIDGQLWELTYSEMAPPDSRQGAGPCPHCNPARTSSRQKCEDCGIYPADLPSSLCPGCEAYREHQQ